MVCNPLHCAIFCPLLTSFFFVCDIHVAGSLWDGAFSLLLGFIVGVVDIIASRSSLFASVMEFTAALLVSFMARMFQVHLRAFHLCYFAMALSSLVQLLPGTRC